MGMIFLTSSEGRKWHLTRKGILWEIGNTSDVYDQIMLWLCDRFGYFNSIFNENCRCNAYKYKLHIVDLATVPPCVESA